MLHVSDDFDLLVELARPLLEAATERAGGLRKTDMTGLGFAIQALAFAAEDRLEDAEVLQTICGEAGVLMARMVDEGADANFVMAVQTAESMYAYRQTLDALRPKGAA